jgi:CxxC-x17-CxxC domain-containing protein
MRDSDRGNRFGGRRDGGRRDGGRPTMYQAVCAECGKDCEVPFQPTGDKPVYCSTCFGNKGGNERRSNDRDSGRRDSGRDFGRSDFREKRMYSAICDKCGKQCEVPFRPTEGKPVFCDACFTRPERDNNGAKRTGPTNADQLAAMNYKLESIIKALQTAGLMPTKKESSSAKASEDKEKAKEVKTVKEVKAVKEPAVKKVKAAKKTSKKK